MYVRAYYPRAVRVAGGVVYRSQTSMKIQKYSRIYMSADKGKPPAALFCCCVFLYITREQHHRTHSNRSHQLLLGIQLLDDGLDRHRLCVHPRIPVGAGRAHACQFSRAQTKQTKQRVSARATQTINHLRVVPFQREPPRRRRAVQPVQHARPHRQADARPRLDVRHRRGRRAPVRREDGLEADVVAAGITIQFHTTSFR
jgi:hypothetical protein